MKQNSDKKANKHLQFDELTVLVIGCSSDDDFMHDIFDFVQRTAIVQFHWQFCESVNEAEKIITKNRIDVILLDLSMQEERSREIYLKIKAIADRLPIIVLTSLDTDFFSLDLPVNGVQDYLAKAHLDSNFLTYSIIYVLKRFHMEQELEDRDRALRESEARLKTIFQSTPDAILVIAENGNVNFVNPVAEKVFQTPKEQFIDSTFPFEIDPHAVQEIELDGENAVPIQLEMRNTNIIWDEKQATLVMLRDITENKKLQAQWERAREIERHLAYHDTLTNLPNRQLFYDRLRQAIAQAKRHSTQFALLFLDLDGFKEVNDLFGHSKGDQLLKQIARRIKNCVRAMDTVARLGGDEFVILLTDIRCQTDAAKIARKTITQIEQKYILGQDSIGISTSIGIAMYPHDGESGELLLKNADSAMYRAKSAGKGIYQFFQQQDDQEAIQRLMLEKSLIQAFDQNQFELFFQPRISGKTGEAFVLESLIRWNHPQMGLLKPKHFLNIAENTDLILKLDRWVIEHAMAECQKWQATAFKNLKLAIPVSSKNLRNPFFPQYLQEMLKKYKLKPASIYLDFKGYRLHLLPKQVNEQLHYLDKMGICLVFDGFGLHRMPVTQLQELPFNVYKMDTTLSQAENYKKQSPAIKSLIAMAHNLDKKVHVAHIETQEQALYFKQLNTDSCQGHYFAPPQRIQETLNALNSIREKIKMKVQQRKMGKSGAGSRGKITKITTE